MRRASTQDVAVYVVWSPQLGAQERHVADATKLIPDARVRHFWDPSRLAGAAYQEYLGLSEPAWDVWLLFDRTAVWHDGPPAPAWWEHQLGALAPDRHLDPSRFARVADSLASLRAASGDNGGR